MKHIAVITKKPVLSGNSSTPDGAIAGNGDLAVILGNAPEGVRLYLSKNDLWWGAENYDIGGLKPLGMIDIPVEPALYDRYRVEQDLDLGELRCRFGDEKENCSFSVTVLKTENALVIEQTGERDIAPLLKSFAGETDGRKGEFACGEYPGIFRSFDGEECKYETHMFAAMKPLGDGKFYFYCATNHDTENPRADVTETLTQTDLARLEELKAGHREAWANMWAKSSFTVEDADLELGWYSSQYFLMVSAGNRHFAPGIFGNFITVERPNWHSDYHLNYNYQAPFYAACSSNHVEFTDCYMVPLEEFRERGAEFAARMGCGGVIYPVGIAPKGICTEWNEKLKYPFERLFLGQKSNAVHPANIPLFRWRATRDTDYAREHAYPFVKDCLAFFEDYCVWEKKHYSVCRDATHEVPYYRTDFNPKKFKRYINDKNNALTLGMLRLALANAIDMAKALEVDEEKQLTWQKMLDNLAPFSTYRRFGRKVYRYTEKGQMWNHGGDVGLQHIYPAGCVGLSSPKKDLQIARTTYEMKTAYCFEDDNAVSSFFPMGARLGFAPEILLQKLRELNAKKRLPNLLYKFGGGCLEDCSLPAATLNEMVLQSHQDTVRIFPCWDNNLNCAYRHLRADGAFLVDASIHNKRFGQVTITAEKGGHLRCVLPFKGFTLTCGDRVHGFTGNGFETDTRPGDVLVITPNIKKPEATEEK